MPYFPIYLNLKDKRVLIVGGGDIALRKLKKVLEFSTSIEVISKDFLEEFKKLADRYNLKLIKREFKYSDLDRFNIVVVATNSIKLQKDIYIKTRDKNILVNSVDSTKYCDFIFPSYIKRGDLLISISTNGIAPTISKLLKEYIEKIIPPNIDIFLKEMKKLRESLPKGESRMRLFRLKSREFIKEYFV
jgi:precorrin-2 dehydrogenase/sirohydrochlorin ferrochelatase